MAISRLLNKTDTESVQAEKISPETKDKLFKIKENTASYSFVKVLNELKQKRAAGKSCSEDLIWVAELEEEDFPFLPFVNASQPDDPIDACSMTPVVFAVLADAAELIPWMMKTVKGSSADIFAKPVFYRIGNSYGDYSILPCDVDTCSALLAACSGDHKIEKGLLYSLLNVYGRDREKGWLSILPVKQNSGPDYGFYHRFPLLSSCVDTGKLVEFLLYIKKRDTAMYAEMMSSFVYITILLCGLKNGDDRNIFIKNMKKLYLEEFGDEKLFWDIFLKKETGCTTDALLVWNPFFCPDYPYARVWKQITGRPLLLNADELDLADLYSATEDSSGSIPPFGFNNNEYVTDDGRLTGYLLINLVNNSEMVVYGKHPGKALFDVEHILKSGTEELVLMALRKDFIRKEDMDVCFSYIKKAGKRGIAPALVLKQHGEWPSYVEADRASGDAKGRRQSYE